MNVTTIVTPERGHRAAPEGFDHDSWVGADEVQGSAVVDLSDQRLDEGLVGVEITKLGPAEYNRLGYWPMTREEGAAEHETDDVHASLAMLCDDYGMPLELTVDRLCMALLRAVQASAGDPPPAGGTEPGHRAAPTGIGHNTWVGADEVNMGTLVDLADLGLPEGIIGIQIQKEGPDDSNLFGYWPATRATWAGARPDEIEVDDVHTSLPALCENYGIPLDLVVDRISVGMLRAQRNLERQGEQ